MDTPYSLIVMDHFRHPRHKGRLKKSDRVFAGANYSCGDQLTFRVKLDSGQRISDVAWEGEGCVISQAAASLYSEMIMGKTLAQARKISGDRLVEKLKVKLSPLRRKCAVLPTHAISEKT